jgi:hypothetical protein
MNRCLYCPAVLVVALCGCGTRSQLDDGETFGSSGEPAATPSVSDGTPTTGDGVSGAASGSGSGSSSSGSPGTGASGAGSGGPDQPDYSDIADPDVRERYEQCAVHCKTIVAFRCGGDSLADGFENCVDSCADRRGRCAPAVMAAFECIASEPSETIFCAADGPVIACGPCDRELERVARRCDNEGIDCRFR